VHTIDKKLDFEITPQPNDTTCGPSCLHSIYRYYGNLKNLPEILSEVTPLKEGGTLAVYLGQHALRNGYDATIYTYNLQVFDPSWFSKAGTNFPKKLKQRIEAKSDEKMKIACNAYIEYLNLGGKILFKDLTVGLLKGILKKNIPILTGLSATYLYRTPREIDLGNDKIAFDDINGDPTGHFVVLYGYDLEKRVALVADPLQSNPISDTHYYKVSISRLACSIMLATLTFDANMLIITPKGMKFK